LLKLEREMEFLESNMTSKSADIAEKEAKILELKEELKKGKED